MAFAALRRLGQSLLGTDAPLQKVQAHLLADEAPAAWQAAVELLEPPCSVEGLAAAAVAAAACDHWEEAARILQGAQHPEVRGNDEERQSCRALLGRVEELRAQQRGERGLLCGPLWRPEPPTELPLPNWGWAKALPQVAEYVGPVEVRWMNEGIGERGLFTSRPVKAGELLLVSRPIASAERNGAPLIAELRRKCAVSGRAKKRLQCLAGGGGAALSPEVVTEALFNCTDTLASVAQGQASEGDLNLTEILNHNVFTVDPGFAALYGLPSMLNHSCDGRGASAMKLVLVFFDKAMIFTATRDLEAGEELCHRYFDVEGSLVDRQGESRKWGFACACRRCSFEAQQLPGTPIGAAVDSALAEFRGELRFEMRALSAALEAKDAEVLKKRWPLLRRLLVAVEAVEAANGHSEEELGWCLALVQKLSNAALWCLLTHSSTRAGDTEEAAPKDPLALRCQVLRRLELGWRSAEPFGYDHLQNLHLLFSALEELRLSTLARAAMELNPEVVEPMTGAVPGRVRAAWPRLHGPDFRSQVAAKGLRTFLEEAGGLVQVKDFLPSELAEETLQMLQSMPQDEWMLSENKSAVDADHRFWRYEGKKLDHIKSIMQDLEPSLHPLLNGAKYEAGGKITLHNDALRWVVRPEEATKDAYPSGATVYRKVALIYYLTKDWSPDFGGCLVDAAGPQAIVPEYNSLIAFLVPREHWVSEMKSGAPARYTLFGWLHDREPYGDELQPLGWASKDLLESQVGDAKVAREHVEAAKEACEHGFRMHFGIDKDSLRLGAPNSPAKQLLRRLAG